MQGRHVSGHHLRALREKRGINRTKLARLSGVSLAWLKCLELEGRQPSGIKVWAIARALDVDIDAFTSPVDDSEADAA